jgi:hypothetical protein
MSRKSPKFSATIFPVKTRRYGIDGNIWEVTQVKNSKRWILSENQSPIKPKKLSFTLSTSNKDIIKSKILNEIFLQNSLKITFDPKKNYLYLHNTYQSTTRNYIGRWYNSDILDSKYKLDGKKKIFTYIIPLYEPDWNKPKIVRNVKAEIYFSDKGWNKFVEAFY